MQSLKVSSQSVVNDLLGKLSSSKSQHYIDFRLAIGLPKTPTVHDNFTTHFLSRRADANPSYLVIYEGKSKTVKFVLRMTPPGQICEGLHDVEREYKLMKELHKRNFPVPEPLYLSTDEDDEYFGTPFFIRDYVEGLNFTDASLTSIYDDDGCSIEEIDITHSSKWRILTSAVKTLGKLHLCSKDGSILDINDDEDNGPGKLRSFWNWRVGLWNVMVPPPVTLQYPLSMAAYLQQTSVTDFNTARNDLRVAIRSLSDRTKTSTFQEGLVHGDFNFPNLVFDPDSKKLKAVLDWEMACVGDVSCDLAEFLMCLLKPSDFVNGYSFVGTSLPQELSCVEFAGEENRKQLVSIYLEKVDRTPQNLYPHLYFAMAVACVRFAAIFLSAKKDGYSGHECEPTCGLPVVRVLLQAQHHFSLQYRPTKQ